MRNLKKILALVLALVMAFSVMSVASAAEFTDGVNPTYADAVEILNKIGVFKGYEDGTFKPQNTITRAEVAAIIYRIDTVDVKDAQKAIYSDYNRFEDVTSDAWYAGYVNYCANAGYVKGTTDTTFKPENKVTGYEALAMILRVVGYDKNNEFTGGEWIVQVAKLAKQLKITAGVKEETLGAPATRELVAQLLWKAMNVPQVTYTLLQGYNQYNTTFVTEDSVLNNTINEDNFDVYSFYRYDDWGRPVYGYCKGCAKTEEQHNDAGHVHNTRKEIIYRVATPAYEGYTAITECNVATFLGMEYDDNATVVENGVKLANRWIDIDHNNLKNDAHVVGEQGTKVELYIDWNYDERIVLIDTYLAEVAGYQTLKTDKAGHVVRDPYTFLNVYTHDGVIPTAIYGNDYVAESYLLVTYNTAKEYVGSVSIPGAEIGYQTTIWYNAEKHTINKVDYLDNANYVLDTAGFDKLSPYVWFFDGQGNVIGSVEPAATANTYAVVLDVQWVDLVGEDGYAVGTVQYMDGTIVEDVIIAAMYDYDRVHPVTGEPMPGYVEMKSAGARPEKDQPGYSFHDGYAYTTKQYNTDTWAHLYQVTDVEGALYLKRVTNEYDGVEIKKGVSQLANSDVYTDNETLFVFAQYDVRGIFTGLEFVKGYQHKDMPKVLIGNDVDVTLDRATDFAQIVYVAESYAPGTDAGVTAMFVYFSNDTTNYTLKAAHGVFGGYGVDGKPVELYFALDAYGTELETVKTLSAMTDLYTNTMVYVEIDNNTGLVKDWVKVGDVVSECDPIIKPVYGADETDAGAYMHLNAGEFVFFDRGVIKVGDVALNTNTATIIINEDGEAIKYTDLVNMKNENLYVVYSSTSNVVKAIFVTSTTSSDAAVQAYIGSLNANDFKADVKGLEVVYTVGDDAANTAAVIAAVENSEIVEVINAYDTAAGADVAVTATVASVADASIVVEVTLTYGSYAKKINLTVARG